MSIIYSLVARGDTVLAEWSDCIGNFTTVTRLLLSRLSANVGNNRLSKYEQTGSTTDSGLETTTPGSQGRNSLEMTKTQQQLINSNSSSAIRQFSYLYDGYVFHCEEDGSLLYVAMAEKALNITAAFYFLNRLRTTFVSLFGTEEPKHAIALAYNNEFSSIMRQMTESFNTKQSANPSGVPDVSIDILPDNTQIRTNKDIERVKSQIAAVQNVMVENIDRILARSEKIGLLVDKTETLNSGTHEFRRQAQYLQRMMWWRKKKFMLLIAMGFFGFLLLMFLVHRYL